MLWGAIRRRPRAHAWKGGAQDALTYTASMDAVFWHEKWKRDEIGFHKREINPLLTDFWGQIGAVSGSTVFVPLCGRSLDLAWLADQGFGVLGSEISPLACQAFFQEHGLSPLRHVDGPLVIWQAGTIRIVEGDFFDLRPEHVSECSVLYDRAALVALPPQMRRRYVAHLGRLFPKPIAALLLTMEYEQDRRPGPPFSVGQAEVRALYSGSHQVERLHSHDAFSLQSPWAQMGLTWLLERVYRLTPISK